MAEAQSEDNGISGDMAQFVNSVSDLGLNETKQGGKVSEDLVAQRMAQLHKAESPAVMAEFMKTLSEFCLHETKLDEKGTEDLVALCMTQLDDADSYAGNRGIALYTLMAQLHYENNAMVSHVARIVQRLTSPLVLESLVTNDHEKSFHREVIGAFSVIHNAHPEALVSADFSKIIKYLVKSLSSERSDLSAAVCDFWVRLASPPVPPALAKHWNAVVVAELPALVKSFINLMIYKPEHAAHLEEYVSSCTDLTKQTLPSDIDRMSSIRNYAALAFEHMCRCCPIEAVCTIFRPIVEEGLNSEDWVMKEVAVLALAAFTEGVGVPDLMRDSYPIIIPRVLDCYSHQRPLVRSIACFTMPKILGFRIRGVKDPLPRVLSCTAKCMRDLCPEVRSMATRGLAAILAYVGGDVAPHTPRLVDALVRANSCPMDPETRCTYYECIAHLISRVVSVLSPTDFEQLTAPLLEHWSTLQWKHVSNSPVEDWLEPELGVIPLVHAICAIVHCAKTLFLPYVEGVFNKACHDINVKVETIVRILVDIIIFAKTEGQGDVVMPIPVTTYLLANLDLLGAAYDGLGAEVAELAVKNNLLALIHVMLNKETFNEMVHQRSFLLLGLVIAHVSNNVIDPPINGFIDIVATKIDSSAGNEKMQASALSALSAIARHPSSDLEKLFSLTDRLIAIFECVDGQPVCIINAAWSLTNLCARQPTQCTAVITRSDVFLHICGLLQAPFPRAFEKTSIFRNVCAMLAPAVSKVSEELWPALLLAVAQSDELVAKDDELQVALRALIRDVKVTLGNSGWSQVQQDIGSHSASILRRRFKLN